MLVLKNGVDRVLTGNYTQAKATVPRRPHLAEESNAGSSELMHCVRFISWKEEHFFLHQFRPALRHLGNASGSLVLRMDNIEFLGPVGG